MSYYNRNEKDRFAYEDDWLHRVILQRDGFRDEGPSVSYCDNREVIRGVACDTGENYEVDLDYIRELLGMQDEEKN